MPGYLAKEDALKELGIDEVVVFCVNDGAVMNAWAADQKVPEESIIKLMGDPQRKGSRRQSCYIVQEPAIMPWHLPTTENA